MSALSASSRIILTEMADGTGVLLHLDTKVYYTLNTTGVTVWKRLAAPTPATEEELAQLLVSTYRVDLETAQADVGAMIKPLVDEGVIVRR